MKINKTFLFFISDFYGLFRMSNPKTIYCENQCGRGYSSFQNMRRHMTFECGSEKRFQCSVCCRKFSHKHHLKAHCRSLEMCRNGFDNPFLQETTNYIPHY